MTDVFIVGCGYVGFRVAQKVKARGQRVAALARSAASRARLQSAGIQSVAGDLDVANSLSDLPTQNTVLYYFAPPPSQGVTDPRMATFLAALPASQWPQKMVLISTTGVYGDCGGAWIDESRPVNPQADRAKRRLNAESILQQWCSERQIPAVILRVPGIYGAERLPIKRLQQGVPVLDESISPFSNRIYVDDLVRACLAGGGLKKCRFSSLIEIYNISDGHPTTMTDYFNEVADALGLSRPPQIDWAAAQTVLSAEMRSYLAESKRLDNRKMREELGIVPEYPDLATGLAAVFSI